ncbi:MAG: hypothetical protein HYY16_07850 [Planctomycetes bacterium]|nr:hypothetical protein [Planctomycetota bacterium]
MTPKLRFGIALTLLASTGLVLWLNVRERDVYLRALEGPPVEPDNASPPAWLPPIDEIDVCQIWARVEDQDGWYRIFWAGTDVYYYDDASYFAGALDNPTAANPAARWTIAGKHQGRAFELAYTLREGPPPEGETQIGPLRVPLGAPWFTRAYSEGSRAFSWVLEGR